MAPSFLISIVAVFAIIFMCHGTSALPGGWEPVDPNDPTVQDIARFAVENNQVVTPLTFIKVVSGESQVVQGSNYHLDIQAQASDGVHDYDAAVSVSLDFSKKLTSFKQI